MIHHFDLETNVKLLQKAQAALRPGGQVAIFDQIEGSVFGSASRAIVKLLGFMFYLFANGRVYSNDELSTMLGKAGFKDEQISRLRQAPGSSLVTAVKG